ncbi:hypothetical protein [Streptomyces sp. NPDC056069]|uniref:hypothetical protein n=1 Tax=Streptomyces sp. NPDC056069 TaxID=3345702 RepID=UPI0035D676C8
MSEAPMQVSPEYLAAMRQAKAEGLQKDLRVLAQRIRNEAPEGSADFNGGIAWAVRFLENTATSLTA